MHHFSSHHHQRGAITMIGALLTLALFAVIMGTFLAYAGPAERRSQANTFANGMLALKDNVARAYAGRGDATSGQTGYAGLTTTTAVNDGLLPATLAHSRDGYDLITPWGGSWAIETAAWRSANGFPVHFRVTITSMSTDTCVTLAHALAPSSAALYIGGWMGLSSAARFPAGYGPVIAGHDLDVKIIDLCAGFANDTARTIDVMY